MTPTETGSYCASCAKNVIDFTQLKEAEILKVLANSGSNTCARLTHSQLESPLPILDNSIELSFPTSKIAAGLMLATSLTIGQTAHAKTESVTIEFVENSKPILPLKTKVSNHLENEQKLNDTTVFKGKVISEDLEMPVENAKITLVTSQKLFSTYTKQDGTFSLEIPSDLINDKNVVRVSYDDITEAREDEMFIGYLTRDHILSEDELAANHSFTAIPEEIYLGGVAVKAHSRNSKPIVLENGIEIKYSEFAKARLGKNSTCSLHNKDFL